MKPLNPFALLDAGYSLTLALPGPGDFVHSLTPAHRKDDPMFRAPVRQPDHDEMSANLLKHAALMADVLEGVIGTDWASANPARVMRIADLVERAWHCIAQLAPEFSAAKARHEKETIPLNPSSADFQAMSLSLGVDQAELCRRAWAVRGETPTERHEDALRMGRLMARLAG